MKKRIREQSATKRRSIQQTASTTKAVMGTRRKDSTRGKSIEPKWAWHYQALLKLRDDLLKQRGEKLKEAAEPLEPHSLSIADSATDEFDHNLALSELSAQQNALYEVEEAIRRILDGTYGTCEESGKPIPAARLRVIPWTRFSHEVEARLEDKNAVTCPRLGPVSSIRGPKAESLEETETPEEERPSAAPEDESLRAVYSPTLSKPVAPRKRSAKKRRR